MNIVLISIAAVTAVAIIALLIRRNKKMKEMMSLLEFAQNQIDELQDAIIRTKEFHETAHRRDSDQARRIAWLETKIRKPRPSSNEVLDDSVITEKETKLSMTERRHRVISLAGRGKSSDAIAASLGLFKGEVELILNLNKAALGRS
jgi:type II secretory pathway pseudopilin PulG